MEIQALAEHLCAYFGTDLKTLRIKNRQRPVVIVRQMIMKYISQYYSLHTTGNIFMLDHATVIHARKTISNLCQSDMEIKKKWDAFKDYASELFSKHEYRGFGIESSLNRIVITREDFKKDFSTITYAKTFIDGYIEGVMERESRLILN